MYKDKINHILTCHEQNAAHAADGFARASGKVGVCLATSGPGATALSGKYVQTDGRYPHRGRSKITGRWHYFGKG